MKFKDIKVGDTVFISQDVNAESFFVPKKVSKVTPTQFCVGDLRFNKKDGKQIGVYSEYAYFENDQTIGKYTYFENDQTRGWKSETVTDQTAEMEAFKQKLQVETQLRRKFESLKLDRNSGKSLDELNEILAIVKQLENKLK